MRTRSTSSNIALRAAGAVIAFAILCTPAAHAQPTPKPPASIADVKRLMAPKLAADAKEVSAALAAKANDTISVRGYIPHTDGFDADAAEFLLVQTLAPAGGVTPPGTPRAKIRILGADNAPLKGKLDGEHMLKPGAEVFVTGKVESTSPDTVVISARTFHVPPAPLPQGFFTDAPAANARDVSEARKAGFKIGEDVVLKGRVGGSAEPFVGGRAVCTLVGRGLKACNENPGDKCKKPWDYCCDTREEILANSVTVQVVNAKWDVLRTDLKGRHGLKELTEVVIVGRVVLVENSGVVINATSMYVPESTDAKQSK